MSTTTVHERNEIAAKVLFDAAAHIEKVGLFKGDYFKDLDNVDESPCCTLGAIHYVTDSPIGYTADEHFKAAANALIADLSSEEIWNTSIQDWNDKSTQRKGRVVARLRKVAKDLEAAL